MRYYHIIAVSSILMTCPVYAKTDSADITTAIQPVCPLSGIMAQNHMFDGIEFTGQMRDLTEQLRSRRPKVSLTDITALQKMAMARVFNEAAVKGETEKIARQHAARQVELIRVENQMVSLLTRKQQVQVQHNIGRRINEMCLSVGYSKQRS